MTTPTVVQAINAVMEDVQAVRKGDRNTTQNFNFRGIDSVVNAVGPAFRKHGVIALPVAVEPHHEQYETSRGTMMRNTTLTITFRFYGPAGDYIEAQAMGEASDAGDKSVPKAHSVAYRTLLLQALCIPTDEPDADAASHERAVTRPAASDPAVLRARIAAAGQAQGRTIGEIGDDFAGWSEGVPITEADVEALGRYLDHITTAGIPA